MRTLTRVEQEVTVADGSATYMTRILPYRTVDNVIDSVVITFIDITERKRSEEDRARLSLPPPQALKEEGILRQNPKMPLPSKREG